MGFRPAARVLVPFGLIPEKAAKGFWAEALRLVLTPTTPTLAAAAAAAADVAAASDQQAESGNSEDNDAEEAEEEEEEKKEEKGADADPVDGRRGHAAVVEGGGLTLPGGSWDEVSVVRCGAAVGKFAVQGRSGSSSCF